jgi:hypothetical protein
MSFRSVVVVVVGGWPLWNWLLKAEYQHVCFGAFGVGAAVGGGIAGIRDCVRGWLVVLGQPDVRVDQPQLYYELVLLASLHVTDLPHCLIRIRGVVSDEVLCQPGAEIWWFHLTRPFFFAF